MIFIISDRCTMHDGELLYDVLCHCCNLFCCLLF